VQFHDGTLIEYLIDGSGRRVGRKVNGVVTHKWLYSNDLKIVAELDSANQITSRFIYASSGNVPEYMVKNGITYRIIADHLGSMKQVVNATTGAIVQKVDYGEYGNVVLDTNPGFTSFGFAGGLFDTETKLVRFGARDYDATIGRWVVKDPIGFSGMDGNFYGYVGQDPINFNDPRGLWKSDQHRELTQKAMPIRGNTSEEARRNGGFTADEEKWAEDANVVQDDPLSSSAYVDEFHGTGSMSLVITVANMYLALASNLQMIDNIYGAEQKGAMINLGKGLHTIQDASAHQGYGSGAINWINHAIEDPNPDDWNQRPDEYKQAGTLSYIYIQCFLHGTLLTR
jgi:RHS repeat-associated protein